MRGIKVISLDLDGTIVDKRVMDYFWLELIPQRYAALKGLELREAKEIVLREYDKVGMEDIRWYLPDYWARRFGLEGYLEELFEDLRSHVRSRICKDVFDLLRAVPDEYSLIISSNAAREFIKMVVEELEPYSRRFQRFFSCVSDFYITRKDARFYRAVCRTLGVKPSEIIHVGDHEVYDYEVPRSVGLKALLLIREGVSARENVETIRSLRELLHYL